MKLFCATALILSFLTPTAALADTAKAMVFLVSPGGVGDTIGQITFLDGKRGLEIDTAVHGLPPGEHGFHIHEKGSCDSASKDGIPTAALAAGDHFDPHSTGKHLGPDGAGHHGDLPPLIIGADGGARVKLGAPRLKVSDIKGRSIMIHASGDNFSDEPKPLGGGGARIACGVIN